MYCTAIPPSRSLSRLRRTGRAPIDSRVTFGWIGVAPVKHGRDAAEAGTRVDALRHLVAGREDADGGACGERPRGCRRRDGAREPAATPRFGRRHAYDLGEAVDDARPAR